MTVAVITDSAASLTPEIAVQAGIVVVPLRLTVGGASYRDDEIPVAELLRRLDEGVTTSGPTPGDLLEAIEGGGGTDGTLAITVTASLSGTYESARMAARMARGEVRVLDSATATGGQGLVALAAARAARQGRTLDDVEAAARRTADRVRLVASLGTLDHLVAGGHVPEAAGWASRRLGLRTIVELRRGKVRPLRPARSDAAVQARILGEVRTSRRAGAVLHVAALHGPDPGEATQLLNSLREEMEPATALLAPFSSVLVIHTGPDLVGLAWWWEESAERDG